MTGSSRKHTRKMRGGNFYGAAGAIVPGAMQWDAVRNAGADSATGATKPELYGGRRRGRKSRKVSRRRRARRGGQEPDPSTPAPVPEPEAEPGEGTTPAPVNVTEEEPEEPKEEEGGRRRKSKKAKKSKKSRKVSRRRKMRGGASQYLPGNASAGFTGEGQRGMGNYVDVGSARHNGVVPLS